MKQFLKLACVCRSKPIRGKIAISKLALLLIFFGTVVNLNAQNSLFAPPSGQLRAQTLAEKSAASNNVTTNFPANISTNISTNVTANITTNFATIVSTNIPIPAHISNSVSTSVSAIAPTNTPVVAIPVPGPAPAPVPTMAPVPTPTPSPAPAPAADPGTNAVSQAAAPDASNSASAPEPGMFPLLNAATVSNTNKMDRIQELQIQLDLARDQRRAKNIPVATQILLGILHTNAPAELQRLALFELALANQDDNQPVKAQQIFAQYLHTYPEDPSVPEVLLRQGLIYRQMGVTTLAVSKFYAVMSTALKLKLDNMDYYKKLVLQAQLEIADTYYLEGKYEESADYFSRLLKDGSADLNRSQVQYKLIRSLSFLTNHVETVAKSQVFLDTNPNSSEVPEVRFILASSLKKLERNHEAMKQVLLLLQSQQENVRKNPETWIYWQQRAGNEIANQLFKEGDYLNALQIYLSLADLDKSPSWQFPVWYQSGLVYEQLQQWQKAGETYQRILDRQKELTETNSTPSLQSLVEMAKWRKDYLDWTQKAKITNLAFQPSPTNTPATVANK